MSSDEEAYKQSSAVTVQWSACLLANRLILGAREAAAVKETGVRKNFIVSSFKRIENGIVSEIPVT